MSSSFPPATLSLPRRNIVARRNRLSALLDAGPVNRGVDVQPLQPGWMLEITILA
jgi:hypothetical protein